MSNNEPLLFGSRRSRRSMSEETQTALTSCAGIAILLLVIFLSMSFDHLKALEYGIVRNTITGQLDYSHVYEGGLRFVGPFHKFVRFPAGEQTIEFSDNRTAIQGPVQTRTGKGPGGSDKSAGQNVNISLSFQYKFDPNLLPEVYKSLALNYQQRYTVIARNVISDVSQMFSPFEYWTSRYAIADQMLKQMNESLYEEGYVYVTRLQVMRVDFSPQYEDAITATEVQNQETMTQKYNQTVQDLLQGIEVLKAKANATIVGIAATASATSSMITNEASAQAYSLVQKALAQSYKSLQQTLGLTNEELLTLIKMKAIRKQSNSQQVLLGTADPFN
eukprot:g4270.t1